MDQIPYLPLSNIFKNLDRQSLQSCSQVCSIWRAVFEHEVGFSVYIGTTGTSTCSPNPNILYCRITDIELIAQIGISECVFSTGWLGDEIPAFKYPRLMKKIQFNSHISEKHFNKIVRGIAERLQSLGICENALIGFPMTSAHLSFKNLTRFVIWCDKDKGTFSVIDNLLPNILILLKRATFPKLKTLNVSLPTCPNVERVIVETIFNCFMKHFDHLKELEIVLFALPKLITDLNTPFEPQPPIQPKNSEEMDEVLEAANFLSIQHGSVPSGYGFRTTEIVRDCVYNQKNLRVCRHMTSSHPRSHAFPNGILYRNKHTLVCIEIIFRTHHDLIADCLMGLHECTGLKYLTLAGQSDKYLFGEGNQIWIRGITPGNFWFDEQGHLMGLQYLPPSLEFLQLVFIFVDKHCCDFITTSLPKLKVLRLLMIGETDLDEKEIGFGMDYQSVQAILKQKTIQEIFIYRGTNRNDWENRHFSTSNLIMRRFQNDFDTPICFHLKNDVYVLGPRPNGYDGLWSENSSLYTPRFLFLPLGYTKKDDTELIQGFWKNAMRNFRLAMEIVKSNRKLSFTLRILFCFAILFLSSLL